MKSSSKGFTLIELLVVIAIIGILSAVVLASLNTARSKGSDAAIMANLDTVRTQAEIEYSNNNSYDTTARTGTCPATVIAGTMWDATVVNAVAQATLQSGAANVTCRTTTGASGAWAISAKLVSDSTHYSCVDSTGASSVTRTTAITTTGC